MKALSVLPSQGIDNTANLAQTAEEAAFSWLMAHPDQVSQIAAALEKDCKKNRFFKKTIAKKI